MWVMGFFLKLLSMTGCIHQELRSSRAVGHVGHV